jgi:hypothetical protein
VYIVTKDIGPINKFIIHKYVSTLAPSNYPTEVIQRAKVEIPTGPSNSYSLKNLQLS